MFLTIVAPYYNCSAYIYPCLKTIDDTLSGLDLEKIPVEIIVVDDFNVDTEVRALNDVISILRNYECFRVLRPTQNLGLSDARNFGVQHAKGEYIFFLDSDDYINKNNLIEIIETLFSVRTDMIYFGSHTFSNEHDWREMRKFSFQPRCIVQVDDSVVAQYLEDCTFYAWRFFVQRSILQDVRFHSRMLMEDVATSPLILSHSQTIWYVPLSVVNYRIRPNSIMSAWNPQKYIDMVRSPSLLNDDLALRYAGSPAIAHQSKVLGYKFFYWSISDARKANKDKVDIQYYNQIKDLYDRNFGRFDIAKDFFLLKNTFDFKGALKWILLYRSYYLYHRTITPSGHLKYRALRRKTLNYTKLVVKAVFCLIIILLFFMNVYQLFFAYG